MQDFNLSKVFKGLIWACLGIILFSPLYISSQLFFPFIVTKTIVFMIATEVMFVAYLLLAWKDPVYRLRANMVVILIGIYIVILTLASALGNDFYRGFWSNNERSDGILLLIHLFLFSWVLTSFFRKIKDWLIVFDIFLVASFCVSVIALDQFFGWNHFLASSNGARLAATIGNAGYVGGYMVFGVFIALFMFFKRKNIPLKVWYGFLVMLEMFIALETQTRGAMIALGIGGMIFVLYLLFFYYNKKILKVIGVLIILASVCGISSIYIFKNSDFIRNQPVLSRIASISLKDGSTNNRLVTWGIAWQGFKEKPILGYGQENFYEVFDKYYTTKNTESWFDRSHNMIGDRAITGGIVGLISYLSILLLPFYFLWKFHKNSDKEDKKQENSDSTTEQTTETKKWARKYFIPIIFSILILAYIIQNMFIFEALVTYVPLMMVLCFVGMYGPNFDWRFLRDEKFKAICFWAGIVLLVPMLYFFNIYPVSANADFIKALALPDLSLQQRIDAFENVISRGTYGNQEYRRHYFEFFQSSLSGWISNAESRKQIPQSDMVKFANTMERQLQDQITENNHNTSNYLILMRFFNMAYVFDLSRLNKAIEAFNSAKELSPGRPQIYYELAQTYFYLGNYYTTQKQDKLAEDAFHKSLEVFYFGAQLNYYKATELTELAGYLSWAKDNETYAKVISKDGISGKKIEEITADMISWLPLVPSEQQGSLTSSLKDIVQYFSGADKGNKVLKDQLDSLNK
jgi:O-antigen ligase